MSAVFLSPEPNNRESSRETDVGVNFRANNGVKHKRVAAQEDFDKFDAENSIIYSIDYVIIGTTNLAM